MDRGNAEDMDRGNAEEIDLVVSQDHAAESLEERNLRVERLKMIIQQEREAYKLKRRHQEELHAIVVQEAKAKAALAELLLKKEMKKK